MKFDGKVALITGASSGIGKETAIQFAKHGAKVVVTARRTKEGEETVQEIKAAGGEAIFIQADVSNEKEIEKLVNETVKKYGRLDIAFNNAAIEGHSGIMVENQTAQEYDTVFGINVKGLLLSMKYEIPAMRKTGGGSIINNSSVAGLLGFPGASVYAASKHAVIGLTKGAALEYATQNIRVNAVCPAVIETDMAERFFHDQPDLKANMAKLHPIGRIGQPVEVAEAVLFLASDGASFITGHSLPVDGGFIAQ